MGFLKVPTIIGIIILAIHSVSSFDCSSPTGKVTCECTATSIECTGILSNVSEIEDVLRLANFSVMETVIVKMDDLKFEPDFAFGNTSIRNLSLGYGLQTLPSYFFEGSSSLVSLNLEKNSIQDIDNQLFSSLFALEELILDGNDLSNLDSSIFMNLPKLKRLSIAGNNLQEIDADVFQHLSALKILTLNHNNIPSIGNLRMTSTSVTELNIANCSIKGALENDSFSGLPNLEHLDLSHNELSEVKPHSLSSLKNLEYLNLSYNSIFRLENNAFFEMRNLTTLDLKYNGISVLKPTCFENLKKLVYLDLSSNRMAAVLCQYTTHFDSLEKIYLQDNRIKTIHEGAFYYSPNLQVLNLTGNILECSCSLTDSALYLIENSTMTRENLESISCVIPSNPPTISYITHNSAKCSVPLEPCKRPDDTQGSSDEDNYDYYDERTTNADDNTTISVSPTIALNIESTTATSTSLPNTSTDISLTTELSTASMTQSTIDTSATSIPPTEPVTVESTSSLIPNTSTIKTTSNSLTRTASITESTMSLNDSSSNTMPNTFMTTESTAASTMQSTLKIIATHISSTEPVKVESTSSLIPNTSTIKTTSNILTRTASITESTTPLNDSSSHTMPNTFMTTESTAASTMQSTPKTIATSISSTEPVTVENTSLLIPSISTIKTTSNVLITDVSTENTTVTKIISSSTAAQDSCSFLDLSVEKLPLSSNFMVFSNFSYDGSTFCLKWTIVGDLKDLKTCVVKYTFKNGTKVLREKCPLNNEIKTWKSNEEIYRICLEIYAPQKRNFCNDTLYGKTIDVVSAATPLIYISNGSIKTEITETQSDLQKNTTNVVTETTLFKETETVSLTEDSIDNHHEFPPTTIQITPDYFTISISVYSNNSNLAFAVWTVSAEAPLNVCTITLTSSTANYNFDYKEGIFPCKNNSHRLRNVKETDIFKVCIVGHHEKYGEATECTLSVSTPLESKSEKEENSYNSALIPLICLLILLIIIVAIIIFKNMKKQESKKYNVRDEENKYDQRVKVRPQSTSDQSLRFSYLARENYDYA